MKEKHLFICHDSKDDEYIQKLKDLVAKHGYVIKNSSIDSSKPNDASNEEYVMSLLRAGIDWSGCVLVLIGKNTHQSEWVDKEVKYAVKKGKPVVGVYLPGATKADVPKSLDVYSSSIEPWQGRNIIAAIEGERNEFHNPDGTKRENPHHTLHRVTCQ